MEARLHALERALEHVRQNQQLLSQRQEANAATNQVLREELLGMGERAGLLEEAVARLAQTRVGGESILRLNEAEFLLSMGAERLSLYADAGAALQAFQLAEGALASLDDPALATLRQTLTQELLQLRATPPDPRPQLRAELSELSRQLTQLPGPHTPPAPAPDSRLRRLLAQLITVRRVEQGEAVLGPAQRQAALAAIALQLERAQAALARPDPTEFRTALAQAHEAGERLFAAEDPRVQAWLERLETLSRAELLPQVPALGATLRELRTLRGARSAAGLSLPSPALPPAPQPMPPPRPDTAPEPADRPAPADEAATPPAPEAAPAADAADTAREAQP